MNPVQVTAAWTGTTYNKFFGYVQAITPTFQDVLDVDFQIDCFDIFQLHSLKYLSSNLYAALVQSDGGSNLNLFYQLNNPPGNFDVADSSGNNYTGSLISGDNGTPIFGSAGPFLYDSSTSIDLTAGSKTPNGGINTVNNSVQPPTQATPLSSTSQWTFECWYGWNSTSVPVVTLTSGVPAQTVQNAILMHATGSTASPAAFEIQLGSVIWTYYAGGGAIATQNIPFNNCVFIGNSSTGYAAAQIPGNYNPWDGMFHHVVVNVDKVASNNVGASVW
jgi:hypothetical protein